MSSKLNLQELLNSNEPVYVLNRTGRMRGGKTSTFILTVKDTHGGAVQVTIPATKWPIDISAMVPRTALRESNELFRACRPEGPLEIVAPDAARAMLQDPMAQKSVDAALAKLERADRRRAETVASAMEVKNQQEGSRHVELPNKFRGQVPQADEDIQIQAPRLTVAKSDVSPKVKQMVAGLVNHPDTADDALALLAGIPDEEMSVEDLGYILKQSHDFPKVTKWAKNELVRRSGPADSGPDDDYDADDPAISDAPARRKRRHHP